MAAVTTDYPDIRHSGSNKSFDKDTGWTETTVTIEQEGGAVTVTEVTSENGAEIERKTGAGFISAVYPSAHLIQITMEDGTRRYFNRVKKEFDNSAELIFRRSSLQGFDYRNRDHLLVIRRHLHAIASVFLQMHPFIDDARPEWSRSGLVEEGRLGDSMTIRATLHDDRSGAGWFGAWITLCNTPPGYVVRTYIRRGGSENWDIVVACPPEWHPQVNDLIDGIFKEH